MKFLNSSAKFIAMPDAWVQNTTVRHLTIWEQRHAPSDCSRRCAVVFVVRSRKEQRVAQQFAFLSRLAVAFLEVARREEIIIPFVAQPRVPEGICCTGIYAALVCPAGFAWAV